ncbi:MAG: indolepyruvate oxidoreductase subunit beta [Magnetococcus sp. WYHC-3]
MAASSVTDIIVVGIGGQGVMTAAEVLAQAAMAQGHDVKKTEVAGMAQRGGVVSSHVRFGPRVLSPVVVAGQAALVVAFEVAEALRWAGHLAPGGVLLVNDMRLPPPVVSLGLHAYPPDPIGVLRAQGVTVVAVDAGMASRELGDVRLVNSVMLGAAADHLPFPPGVLRDALLQRFRSRKPELLELNRRAFERGRELASRGR